MRGPGLGTSLPESTDYWRPESRGLRIKERLKMNPRHTNTCGFIPILLTKWYFTIVYYLNHRKNEWKPIKLYCNDNNNKTYHMTFLKLSLEGLKNQTQYIVYRLVIMWKKQWAKKKGNTGRREKKSKERRGPEKRKSGGRRRGRNWGKDGGDVTIWEMESGAYG